MKKLTPLSLAIALMLSTGLGACTPTHKVHGNLIKDHQIENVAPGEDTQSDILRKLGSPTTTDPFNNNVWYYIGQETEKRGILDPEVIDERIIVVSFKDGYVDQIENVDNERLDIPYSRDETATSGNSETMLQQFLGNLGRFNTEDTGIGVDP